MAAAPRVAVVFVALMAAQALILNEPVDPFAPLPTTPFHLDGDHLIDNSHKDSKPGSPLAPSRPVQDGLVELWRAELSQRVLKAAAAHDALGRCGSFQSFGDFTWCRAAMPWEFEDREYRVKFGGLHLYIVNQSTRPWSDEPATPELDALAALSFGVGESDLWSELLSNLHHVKTELFDCYYDGKKGPMMNNLHLGHSPDKPCQGRHCYTAEYHTWKICLDDTSTVNGGFKDVNNRKHAPLSQFLKGRAPLSTFLKMDVEGAEWGSLEQLLKSDEQIAKIRTLDVQVHFNRAPQALQTNQSSGVNMITNNGQSQASLTHNVEILERLAEKFAVTGSTLEHNMNAAAAHSDNNGVPTAKFFGQVATKDGFSLDQFSISFVNRQLMPPWESDLFNY